MFKKGNPYTTFLIFFTLTTINLWAQDNPVFSFHFQNQRLRFILKEISQVTSYKFAYSSSEIDVDVQSSFTCENLTIKGVVEKLSVQFNLSYEIVGTTVILKPLKVGEYKVSGTVRDFNDKSSLPGVNIFVKGLKKGTVTDSAGNFTISVPLNHNQLLFSYVGYKTQLVAIHSDTIIRVQLKEDVTSLEEVIVVAFGNEQRNLLSGSVSVVDPQKFSQLNESSILETFQTSITGVNIQVNAGTPGSSAKINIRGITSITAGNSPLFVVDGVPAINGNFSQLDFGGQAIDAINEISVNDIESITVLKDASASALFGTRASNGVVLITTKRGKPNSSIIQVDTYWGFQQANKKLNMLNAKQWMTIVNEEEIQKGNPPVYSDDLMASNTIDTRWLDKVFRVAPIFNTHLFLNGGNEKSTYHISGSYQNQEGIIIGSDYKRLSTRVNYDYKISNRLRLEIGNGFSFSQNHRVEGDQSINGPLPNAISMPPIYPVYNPDGTFNNDGPYANPVSIAREELNLAESYRNISNALLSIRASKNLQLASQLGIDYYNLTEKTYAPKQTRLGARYDGLGIEATNHVINLYFCSYANCEWQKQNHNISAMLGASGERYFQHGSFLRTQNFPGSSINVLEGGAIPIVASSNEVDALNLSFFGRFKYLFYNRYLFTLIFRRDGSSKFGVNNRFGNFPAASVRWNVNDEPFYPKAFWMPKAKLSVSYGLTGNDQISDFRSLNLFAPGANYGNLAGLRPAQVANPNLKWESTRQFNTGVSLDWFNRLRVNLDYYIKHTNDLLYQLPLPPSSGFSYIISNIGSLRNSGIEVDLNADIVNTSFLWNLGVSITANRNRVLNLYQNTPIRNIGRAASSIEENQPISFFYGYKALGVNRNNGDMIYADITPDGVINDRDKVRIGSPFPDFFGAISTMLSYRSFTLNINIFYSVGNEIFNATRMYTETLSKSNQTTAVLRRWKHPGDITDVPRASTYNKLISSRFIEDGSFVRLKNLKLSYNVNKRLLNKTAISDFEVYLAGKNLLTWTRYTGMDPEVNYNGENSIVMGTDFFTCPQPKTIIAGVCVKF